MKLRISCIVKVDFIFCYSYNRCKCKFLTIIVIVYFDNHRIGIPTLPLKVKLLKKLKFPIICLQNQNLFYYHFISNQKYHMDFELLIYYKTISNLVDQIANSNICSFL